MPASERARSAEEGEASEAEGRAAVGPDRLDGAHQYVDPNHDQRHRDREGPGHEGHRIQVATRDAEHGNLDRYDPLTRDTLVPWGL